MSTDRQRLKTAIQRIAEKSPAISEAIGASKSRGGQASSTGVGVSDSERDNLCCNGTTGDGANAGAETRDPDEDGEDGLDDTDPADLSMGQGSLTGITDCATGEPLCFDGGGFIPPDGWDDPQDPPPDDTFDEDIYGRSDSSISGTSFHRTCAQAYSGYVGGLGSCSEFAAASDCDNLSPGLKASTGVSTGAECNDTGSQISSSYGLLSCTDDPHPICDDPQPTEEFWPEDGCTNLAIYGGKIVGSKFDPENDGSYSAPRDELEVCDSSGNRILLRGSPTGGWKSIKSLSGDIDPDTGNGYLYRPSGKRVRQISPSEFRDDTV